MYARFRKLYINILEENTNDEMKIVLPLNNKIKDSFKHPYFDFLSSVKNAHDLNREIKIIDIRLSLILSLSYSKNNSILHNLNLLPISSILKQVTLPTNLLLSYLDNYRKRSKFNH